VKITDLRVFVVNPGHSVSFGTGWGKNWIFVKISTDAGVDGIGEAFGTGQDLAVQALLEGFGRWLIGKDPTRIGHHWQALVRSARYPMGTASMSAVSAVEMALWDIGGKVLGVPVYRMLGGPCRDRLRVYAGGLLVPGHKDQVEGARAVVARGFRTVKCWPQPSDYVGQDPNAVAAHALELVRSLRDALGPAVGLCMDYHGRSFSPADALHVVKALEGQGLLFVEEPTLYDNVDSLVELKAKTSVPIAAGEKIVGRAQWRELIARRAVDIVQPDPAACGGIAETIKLAGMAEAYHVLLAPHHASGPVSLAACAQIAACVPNFFALEYGLIDSDCARALCGDPPSVRDGYMALPERPGLGVTFDEEAALAYPYRPFDRPVVIDPHDGAVDFE
jgi:galactonate dehydratase